MRVALLASLLCGTYAASDASKLISEARAAANRGEIDRAEQLLLQAEADAPGEALMLRANLAAFVRKDQTRALALFRESVAADATRWDARYFMGRVLADQQRWEESIDAFASASELNPSSSAVLLELGQAQAAHGDGAFATTLVRAAALDVHSAQPLLVLAQTAMQRGQVDVALRAYEDVSELHPWHAQPMMQLASLRATLSRAAVGTPDAALAAAAAARAGAPAICELRDAALSLQPSMTVPASVLDACSMTESKRRESKVAPLAEYADDALAFATSEAAAAHAKAIMDGPCAFLKEFPSLASRAVPSVRPEGGGAGRMNACVVQLPAGRAVRLRGGVGGVGGSGGSGGSGGGGGGGGGSGVVVPSGSHLIVESDGDAPAVLDAAQASRHFLLAGDARLTLRRVHFRNGRSLLSGGGAVLVLPGAVLDATDVTFEGNRAVLGSGGAIASHGATLRLKRVTFLGNEATLRGGALLHASYSAAGAAEELLHTGLGSVHTRPGSSPGSSGSSGSSAGFVIGSSPRAATAELAEVVWEANRAGRVVSSADVMLCKGATLRPHVPLRPLPCMHVLTTARHPPFPTGAGATLRPRPRAEACALSECDEQSASNVLGTVISADGHSTADGSGTGPRLMLSAPSLMARECSMEALEVLNGLPLIASDCL